MTIFLSMASFQPAVTAVTLKTWLCADLNPRPDQAWLLATPYARASGVAGRLETFCHSLGIQAEIIPISAMGDRRGRCR